MYGFLPIWQQHKEYAGLLQQEDREITPYIPILFTTTFPYCLQLIDGIFPLFHSVTILKMSWLKSFREQNGIFLFFTVLLLARVEAPQLSDEKFSDSKVSLA